MVRGGGAGSYEAPHPAAAASAPQRVSQQPLRGQRGAGMAPGAPRSLSGAAAVRPLPEPHAHATRRHRSAGHGVWGHNFGASPPAALPGAALPGADGPRAHPGGGGTVRRLGGAAGGVGGARTSSAHGGRSGLQGRGVARGVGRGGLAAHCSCSSWVLHPRRNCQVGLGAGYILQFGPCWQLVAAGGCVCCSCHLRGRCTPAVAP